MHASSPADSSGSSIRIPKWIAIVIVVLISLLMLIFFSSILIEGPREVGNWQAKLHSECIPVDANEKSVLIAIAGFLAQRYPPDFIREPAEKTVSEIRGMENAKAAAWIVRHYDQLQFDSNSNSFRTNVGATIQP